MLRNVIQQTRGFGGGMRLPLEAINYLVRRPKLWLLVLIPLILNLVIFTSLIGWGFHTFAQTLDAALGQGPEQAWYWKALGWLATALFWVVVFAVVYFIWTPIALLIAAPFNDKIAESVEREAGFDIEDTRPFWKALPGEILYALLCEAKRMGLILGVFAFLFLFNLLPGLGSLVYLVGGFAWGCWAAALEFIGFAADRRHLPLGEKWQTLKADRATTFGFGLATFLLMMIPFFNVLMVPVSAVGGTLLFGSLHPHPGVTRVPLNK